MASALNSEILIFTYQVCYFVNLFLWGGECATLSDVDYLWLHFSVSDTDCSTV